MALVALATMALSGCSSDDTNKFTGATACSMPASAVTTALGTDRFIENTSPAQPLPIDGSTSSSASYRCTVKDGDDNKIVVIAKVAPIAEVTDKISQYGQSGGTFTHDAGTGFANSGGGSWACGQVELDVIVQGDPKPTVATVTTLVTAAADQVGCWKRAGTDRG
jgi:hypothetical protein